MATRGSPGRIRSTTKMIRETPISVPRAKTARRKRYFLTRRGYQRASDVPQELAGERPRWSDEKGPAARRRPPAAREAYSLYVERAAEGANCRASEGSARPSDGLTSDDHADGPCSAAR